MPEEVYLSWFRKTSGSLERVGVMQLAQVEDTSQAGGMHEHFEELKGVPCLERECVCTCLSMYMHGWGGGLCR